MLQKIINSVKICTNFTAFIVQNGIKGGRCRLMFQRLITFACICNFLCATIEEMVNRGWRTNRALPFLVNDTFFVIREFQVEFNVFNERMFLQSESYSYNIHFDF